MASSKPKKEAEPPKRSQFEKFESRQIHRSLIKNAAYNPRVISDKSKKLLRDNIRRVGLVAPVTWNERTGNIVGGHQRIAAMDSLEGTDDYLLTVSVVDMDEKTEKEQNVFLNNPGAQGDFDLEKLQTLLSDPELQALNTGFSTAEVYQLFGESAFAGKSAELVELSEQVKASRDAYRKLRDRKTGENDCDFYFVVVFADNASRERVSALLDLDDNKYLDGLQFEQVVREWRELRGERDIKQAEATANGEAVGVMEGDCRADAPANGTGKPRGFR